MQIVPFNSPSALSTDFAAAFAMFADINKDVITTPSFPSLSIKGKVFTFNKDGVKKILTKPGTDGEEEVAQSVGVVILRANMKAKTFYAKKFSGADSDGARPDCYSFDGEKPSSNSPTPQANKCAICPHNQWGSRTGDGDKEESKGKACSDNARLAVATPDKLDEPMLLRVPPASLKNLRELVKELNARKTPYNVVATRIGFDPAEASPKLTFKPVGFLPPDRFAMLKEMYENETVRAITGMDDIGIDAVAPIALGEDTAVEVAAKAIRQAAATPLVAAALDDVFGADDEPAFEAAPVAAVVAPVVAKPAPVAKPVAVAKPTPVAKPAPVAEAPSAAASLMGDLDALLGGFDD